MYEQYEAFKAWLREQNITPEQYEKAIKQFAEAYGI